MLNAELRRRSARNPAYSLRAYARDLGISPAHLSAVLKGQALLSPKKAKAIAQGLGWMSSSDSGNEMSFFATYLKESAAHLHLQSEQCVEAAPHGQKQQVLACALPPKDLARVMDLLNEAFNAARLASATTLDRDAEPVVLSWHMFRVANPPRRPAL